MPRTIKPNLSRSTSTRGDFSSSNRSKKDWNIEEGVALLVKREKEVRKSLNVGLVMNMVIMHLSVLKERKSIRELTSLEKIEIFCMQMKTNELALITSDDEIGFVEIK